MADLDLSYIDENGDRQNRGVVYGQWEDTPGGAFRVRDVSLDDRPFAVQKTVRAGQERVHDWAYDALEHEVRVGVRLALRYRQGYPTNLPRLIGHDMDGELPFLLHAPINGRPVSTLRGDLGPDRRVAFMRSLFAGVHLLGSAGLVHTALSAASVLWDDAREEVRIADLTPVRFAGEPHRSDGVRGYAPPEQRHDAPARHTDDVWAAAAISYQAITGQLPAGEADLAHREPEFRSLFEGLFAADPRQRPRARAVLDRLGGWAEPLVYDPEKELEEGRRVFDESLRAKELTGWMLTTRAAVRSPAPARSPAEGRLRRLLRRLFGRRAR